VERFVEGGGEGEGGGGEIDDECVEDGGDQLGWELEFDCVFGH